MELALSILKILGSILPVVLALWWAWWNRKQKIEEATKKTQENAAKEPIQAIDNGNSLENSGTSLENQADKW